MHNWIRKLPEDGVNLTKTQYGSVSQDLDRRKQRLLYHEKYRLRRLCISFFSGLQVYLKEMLACGGGGGGKGGLFAQKR